MHESCPTHDGQKVLEDLRDHLARHDKPIALLFGAGTSCAVRVEAENNGERSQPLIPAIAKLTELCKSEASELGPNYSDAWNAIVNQCSESGVGATIENILSHVQTMRAAVTSDDRIAGLDKSELEELEKCIRKTIAKYVTPDLNVLPSTTPHDRLARWLAKTSRKSPVEIFTLNYDVLIEHALEDHRIPVFDGFVGSYQPFFHPDSLRHADAAPGNTWTRLWKMHGSVTWKKLEQPGRRRIIRTDPSADGEMIYPSYQKYDESRQQPYSAFTDRLTRFLEQDGALLITAGFSFGDEHINNLIFDALEGRPRTHVYALEFDELDDGHDLIRRAKERPNMVVMGPKTGVIGGVRGRWKARDLPDSMAIAFESTDDETKENSESQNDVAGGTVNMKLGDFDIFSQFLELMTGR